MREQKTPEILAERAIFAFNDAIRTLHKMLRTKVFDFKESDKVIREARRRRRAFGRAVFSIKTTHDLDELRAGLDLIGELNTAMTTFNKILAVWNKHFSEKEKCPKNDTFSME